MSVINITADQNQDLVKTLSDAAAAAGDHLIQFFTDDKNVFNIASDSMGGNSELTVNVGVSYVFTIKKEQALLLNGAASSYKHFRMVNGVPTLQNDGTVTVTPLSGTQLPEQVAYQNGNNEVLITGGTAYAATEKNDIIFVNVAAPFTLALPDPETMPGKKIIVLNMAVANNVDITDIITLVTLTPGESVQVYASELLNEWKVFYNNNV